MATSGLYGNTAASSVALPSGSESSGLYGNNTVFGGTYFEWFIFQSVDLAPATPTGGSWNFTTNVGTPPTGWSSAPPASPAATVWVSIAVVNSKNTSTLTWSTPGKFAYSSGLPILSGTGTPASGLGVTDQLYIQTDSAPEAIWFKQVGTWTRLTGSTLYVDLTSTQNIAGVKTFASQIQGSVSGTASNVTGVVAVVNGGTGVTTSTGTGSVVLNNSPLLLTPTLSGATVDNAAPYLNFTPTTAPAYQQGRVFYDSSANTLNYYNDNSQMSINIGQENIVRVRNQTGSTIANGSVVYINGATGNTPTVALALATAFNTADIVGVATTDIANNGFGYATTSGLVNGINTSAFTDGQIVFVSATTPGAFTATEPTAPNYSVQVGVITRANPSVGALLVSIQIISTEVAHIVGTVPVSQGGTGQITANDGFNALAPSQTGNSGKYLTTDGSNTSWAVNPLGTVTSVAATVPAFLSISGSPITTSGTLAIGLSGTALPVLNGGTGSTTATGSGSVVLATSPTLVTPLLGTPTSGNFSTGTFTWPTFNQSTTGNATTATTATNVSGGTANVTTLTTSSTVTLNGGTANGVTYLNSSKVLTSGTALTFDGANLGIGTTSPNATLVIGTPNTTIVPVSSSISGATPTISSGKGILQIGSTDAVAVDKGGILTFTANTTTQTGFTMAGVAGKLEATGAGVYNGYLQFITSNAAGAIAEKMRLDSSGTLGLGVTPSAWLSTQKAIDINTYGAVASSTGGAIRVIQNAYLNSAGNWIYKNTSLAAFYEQDGGIHAWKIAPSGTAGATATFTQAMTLDASGNLGIGAVPSAWKSSYKGFDIGTGGLSAAASIGLTQVTSNAYYNASSQWIYKVTDAATYYQQYSGAHTWYSAASGTAGTAVTFTQAMTLNASGQLGIGVASPAVKLDVGGTDALKTPVGTTVQRPTGATGYLRFNTDLTQFEGYNGTAWSSVGGGASGGAGNPIMYENDAVISVSYTMTTGKNASSTGPLTINSGIAVTVPSGSTWVIL